MGATFKDRGTYEAIELSEALRRVGVDADRLDANPERLTTLVAWGPKSGRLNIADKGRPGSVAGGPILFQWHAVGGNPDRGRPYFLINQCEAVVFDVDEYTYRLARLC